MKTAMLITFLLWWLLIPSSGFLLPEADSKTAKEEILANAGYPKPGDVPVLNRKIFKGQRVTIREHPYVASIRRLCSHYLTGALTSRTVVLTVAHPLIDVPVRELNVVLGENYSDRGSTLYTVVLVVVHQLFNPYTLHNDIAMIKIYEHVTYKMNIKSIFMLAHRESLAGQEAFVTGWGRCDNMGTELCLDRTSKYYPDERVDPMLRSISFTITSPNYYCEGYKVHDVTLAAGMLCAGVSREQDPVAGCLAVPGAPLVVGARLVGLLSWGFGCGFSYDLPLIYSNISHFLPWITHNNKVMYKLKQSNLTVLFEATKAAVLSNWIMETRRVKPPNFIRTDRNIEPLAIDYQLIQLKGTIYDVRDYINDGAFSSEKTLMYETMRSEFAKAQTTLPPPTKKPAPQEQVKITAKDGPDICLQTNKEESSS